MCGRSSLCDEPRDLLKSYGLPPRLTGYRPRYNIAPSQLQWVITNSREGLVEVREMRWGLIPSWARDPAIGARMINARAETLGEKPSYRDALHHGRCLIVSDGYYEWTRTPRGKRPIRFQMAGGKAFVLAGLWDRWGEGESSVKSCTVITTSASDVTKLYHDRMPVILRHEDSLKWLQSGAADASLRSLLRPYSGGDLEMFEVSSAVNNPANDTDECIKAVEPDAGSAAESAAPLDLFT